MEFHVEYTVPVTVVYDNDEKQISRVIVHDECLSRPGDVHAGDINDPVLTGWRRRAVLNKIDGFNDLWPGWEFGW